jgi:predicted ATPase/ATP/maltotriose-dependent transcriptional regulator MalT
LVETLRQPDLRLLTLVGSGGIGKTRLAIALADQMTPAFADGVWFVDLSAIRAAALVLPTVAHTLRVQNDGRRTPLDCLQDYLRERHALLVLDNCEQVLDAAPDIASLLSACPDVKVLATSREPLRLRWEHVAPIAPLKLPHGDEQDAGALMHAPAIAFFVQRAQAADPAFRLTEDNRAAVAELCTRLDGLPLALELAAARTRVLSPEALLARLDKQPDLLRGAPDAPVRQRSLRATVEWSYDLLADDEQRLFRSLGVFAGGCSIEAASAVCHGDAQAEVLGGLASLADKSLLRHQRDADGDTRFRLLESMRHVALDMLEASGEAEAAQLRFTNHLLRLAETVSQESWRGDAAIWVHRLSCEHDNMCAALTWLIDTGRIEQACLLAAALEPLWVLRDHLTEGQHLLQAIVARTDDSIADRARTRALGVLALLTALLGDAHSAASLAQQSLVVARRAGEPEWLCLDLWAGAEIARGRGDTVTALGGAREALELSRAHGMTTQEGLILGLLGRLTIDAGQAHEGRALLEQALTILERLDVPRALIHVRRMLGTVTIEMGEVTRGRQLLEQAASGCRALGERWMLSGCLAYLGYALAQQGDVRTARRLLTDSAELAQGSRDFLNAVRYLLGFARLAVAEGHPERAVRLAGATHTLIEVVPERVAASIEKWLAPARSALGAHASAVWDSGQRLSVEQATAYALSAEVPGSPAGSLTSRELEVASLVGRGLTNRHIAEALVIAPSTAERHIANIMNKLAMTTRTQVGVWASENGYT